MQNQNGLVSIIVPAYNAGDFIEETVQSIYQQTYGQWELIIVNDGSTDNTGKIIQSFHDLRVRTIDQANAGVAAARNNGLPYAKGEFVVFFDADDVMTPEFLEERVHSLQQDRAIGFVGGLFQPFPVKEKARVPAASDPENEILFSRPSFSTGPSTYMFRTKILIDNHVKFNEKLSSTADRFFILEVARFAKGKTIGEKGQLLYRVSSQSMSNSLTPKLMIDNERFYYELKEKNLLPGRRKREFKSAYFLSLAKGFGMVHIWKRTVKYLVMSFVNHPLLFLRDFGKSFFKLFQVNKSK